MTKVSTLLSSVGMEGTYWKLGRRKADAGGEEGVSCGTMSGSVPGFPTGNEPDSVVFCEVGSAWEELGWKEELVSITL